MQLREIRNPSMLADFLGVSLEDLNTYLNTRPIIYRRRVDNNKAKLKRSRFIKIRIQKHNPRLGHRIVYKVNDEKLRNIHKVLQGYLNSVYRPLPFVHGFVLDRNIRSNAEAHLAKKQILKVDIKNFFESINAYCIGKKFRQLGCTPSIALALTKLVTINGKLVQGFNTSPVLANMVSESMDKNLEKLAGKHGCDLTRYADDICFSSNDESLPSEKEVESILRKSGFVLNRGKTRLMFRGEKQFVTGLTVFDPLYPRVPKRIKRNMRLALYYAKKFGAFSYAARSMRIKDADLENGSAKERLELYLKIITKENLLKMHIKGTIDYINSIEPALAQKFYDQYKEIKEKAPLLVPPASHEP